VSAPPESAAEFFLQFLPALLAARGEALPAVTSPGSIAVQVGDEIFARRLERGRLHAEQQPPNGASDPIVKLSLSPEDFVALAREVFARFQASGMSRLLALQALEVDQERAKLLRNVDGSVLFEIVDQNQTRRLLLSPGASSAATATAACTVTIDATSFWALAAGEKNPLELMMEGKVRVQGRLELALALSSVFVPT
jgi:putative sterol carrier protein